MSSHHIVKEKQEPALYLISVDNFEEELLGQLLEWSPTVITDSNYYDKIISLGIKVDLVFGDENLRDKQEHTKVFKQSAECNFKSVLSFLRESNYHAVNVILDDLDIFRVPEIESGLTVVYFTRGRKTFKMRSRASLWKPAGTIFWIEESAIIDLNNLQKINKNEFKVALDGFISFIFECESIYITEKL